MFDAHDVRAWVLFVGTLVLVAGVLAVNAAEAKIFEVSTAQEF